MKKFIFTITLLLTIIQTLSAQQVPIEFPLDGYWKISTGKQLEFGKYNTIQSNLDNFFNDSIFIPGNWDTKNQYSQYEGEAILYKEFTVPANLKNRYNFIQFDAVYETAKVFINGNYLGTHKGGYTPFEYEISDLISHDSTNYLLVIADNTYKRGAWWNWGGISRPVKIKSFSFTRINHIHITPLINFKDSTVNINIEYKIENLSSQKEKIGIKFDFSTNDIPKQNIEVDILPSSTYQGTIQIKNLKGLKLWNIDSPNIYNAITCIYKGKTIIDSHEDKFGIRNIKIENNRLFINNNPIRGFGMNRVHDHRAYGNTEPIDLIKKDIDDIASTGAIICRMMHAPMSPELLDYCDEKGILIISEIPIWGKFDPNAFANNPTSKQWLKEMIERDYNHPSIIGWSVGNEIGADYHWSKMRMTREQYRYIASMMEYIKKQLDNTRLLTYASFTAFREEANPETDPAGLGDFISINCYGNMLQNCIDVHKKWNNKPIFITEFGKGQIGEDIANSNIHNNVFTYLDKIQALPYVIGASIWTYNDYRSRYDGSPVSGNRSWGIVDVWRNKKDAFYKIKDVFSPIKSINTKIEKDNLYIEIEPRTKESIPSYAINGCNLSVISSNNDTVTKYLNTIKPNGEKIPIKIKLSKKALRGKYISVSLSNQTGTILYSKNIALSSISPSKVISAIKYLDKTHIKISNSPIETNNYIITDNDTIKSKSNFFVIDSEYKYLSYFTSDDNNNMSIPQTIRAKAVDLMSPPIVQKTLKVNNGYYIGYTVDKEDSSFEFEITDKSNKKYEISTEIKGAFNIETDNIKTIKIRRLGTYGTSAWSQEIQL